MMLVKIGPSAAGLSPFLLLNGFDRLTNMCSVSMSGSSSYFLDGRSVAWKDYNAQLAKFNILVKAKNFLVFQGDVEGVASQDSKALARLIDRISG